MSDSAFQIKSTVKGTPDGVLFRNIKNQVMGPEYELSIVFVGPTKIRELNKKYRDKDKVTDVLSFPLTENSGEIFMCLSKSRTNAKSFDRDPEQHIIYLYIHGLLHLKGLDHGSRMEEEEKKIGSIFGLEF